MTNTTRDLIQRLADALAEWQLGGAPPEDTADADLINEARAYLAQPEPEVPTVENLQAQIHALRADYLRMANAVAKQLPDRDKFFTDLIPDPP